MLVHSNLLASFEIDESKYHVFYQDQNLWLIHRTSQYSGRLLSHPNVQFCKRFTVILILHCTFLCQWSNLLTQWLIHPSLELNIILYGIQRSNRGMNYQNFQSNHLSALKITWDICLSTFQFRARICQINYLFRKWFLA